MLRSLLVLAFLAAVITPAVASEQLAERHCKLFIDQVTARIRAGDIDGQKRHIPRLRQCNTILKAALDREARKIVEDYYAARARSRPKPGDRI